MENRFRLMTDFLISGSPGNFHSLLRTKLAGELPTSSVIPVISKMPQFEINSKRLLVASRGDGDRRGRGCAFFSEKTREAMPRSSVKRDFPTVFFRATIKISMGGCLCGLDITQEVNI